MDTIIRNTYPDCDKNPQACFERYLRDRIEHMKSMGIHKLQIGTFTDTYDQVFKTVAAEMNANGEVFWFNPHSWNIGNVRDKYVYSFMLFLKK